VQIIKSASTSDLPPILLYEKKHCNRDDREEAQLHLERGGYEKTDLGYENVLFYLGEGGGGGVK